MSPRELRAVPPRREPVVLTVDAGSTGALSGRFLTLVVRPHPAGTPAATPASEVDDLPAAS
jgi:hypothetical protein